MGVVRIDFTGLIAYVVTDNNPQNEVVQKITAVFADPGHYGLHPHRPRLVPKSGTVLDWSGMPGGQPLPAAAGGGYDLEGWNINLLADDVPGNGRVRVPQREFPDLHDPILTRILYPFDKVLDMKEIYGDHRMKPPFFQDGPAPGVLGRLTISEGRVQSVSNDLGLCEDWAFVNGPVTVYSQPAAPAVCLIQSVRNHLTLHLRAIADPTKEGHLRIEAMGNDALRRLEILHTCDESTCGDHVAEHLKVYYEMLVAPLGRPRPDPPFSGSGYCPPGRFVPGS